MVVCNRLNHGYMVSYLWQLVEFVCLHHSLSTLSQSHKFSCQCPTSTRSRSPNCLNPRVGVKAPPKNEDSAPLHQIHGSLDSSKSAPKRHLDQLTHVPNTHRHTDHTTCDTTGRINAMHACDVAKQRTQVLYCELNTKWQQDSCIPQRQCYQSDDWVHRTRAALNRHTRYTCPSHCRYVTCHVSHHTASSPTSTHGVQCSDQHKGILKLEYRSGRCNNRTTRKHLQLDGCIKHNTVSPQIGPLYATGVSLGPPESSMQTVSQSLQPFSIFAGLTRWQTDWQTNRPRCCMDTRA